MNEYFLMKHRKTLTFETLDTNFTHEISGFMYIIYEYLCSNFLHDKWSSLIFIYENLEINHLPEI